MMMPIDLLKKLLESQDIVAVANDKYGYDGLDYVVKRNAEGTTIDIPSVEVSFVFDTEGRFQGISNWKE